MGHSFIKKKIYGPFLSLNYPSIMTTFFFKYEEGNKESDSCKYALLYLVLKQIIKKKKKRKRAVRTVKCKKKNSGVNKIKVFTFPPPIYIYVH